MSLPSVLSGEERKRHDQEIDKEIDIGGKTRSRRKFGSCRAIRPADILSEDSVRRGTAPAGSSGKQPIICSRFFNGISLHTKDYNIYGPYPGRSARTAV